MKLAAGADLVEVSMSAIALQAFEALWTGETEPDVLLAALHFDLHRYLWLSDEAEEQQAVATDTLETIESLRIRLN